MNFFFLRSSLTREAAAARFDLPVAVFFEKLRPVRPMYGAPRVDRVALRIRVVSFGIKSPAFLLRNELP